LPKWDLAALSHTAGVRIIGCAAGDGKHAGAGFKDLVLCRSRGDLGGGGYAGEDENSDESTDDKFHDRRAPFRSFSLLVKLLFGSFSDGRVNLLATLGHTAGVWIIGSAAGNREHAGAGCGDLVLGRSGGGLSGGGYAGEDKDDDESANDEFHSVDPFVFINL
jgi:hypothetical protein